MALTKIRITTPSEPFFTKIVLNQEHLIAALLQPAKLKALAKFSTVSDDAVFPTDEDLALSILNPNHELVDASEMIEWLKPSIAQKFGIPADRIRLTIDRIEIDGFYGLAQISWVEFGMTIEE